MKKILQYGKEHPAVTLSLFTFLLLSLAAAGTEINKLDVRFALLVQELDLRNPGVFPTINGISYPDYFLPYFLPAFLTTAGGRFITLWTLSLPTILTSSLLTGLLCHIGEKEQKGLGIAAALLFLATPEAMYDLCGFGLDVPVAAAGCLMLFVFQRNSGWRKTLPVFVLLLAFCTFLRGSLGILVFGSAAGGYLLFRREWERVFLFGIAGALTAAVSGGVILSAIYLQGGNDLLHRLMQWQIQQRIAGGDYFYYFLDGFAGFMPLTLIMVAGLVIAGKRIWNTQLCGWLGWVLCPVILLSIPGGKHLRYLMTILPAMALIGGWGIVNLPIRWKETVLKIVSILAPWLTAVCAVASAAVMIVCLILFPFPEVPLAALSCAVLACTLLFFFRKKFPEKLPAPVLLPIFATAFLVIPLTGLRESSRLFTEKVESVRKGRLYFYDMGPDHEDLKYCLHVPVEKRREFRYLQETPPNPEAYTSKMYRSVLIAETVPGMSPDDIIILKKNRIENIRKIAEHFGRRAEIVHSGDLGHRTYHAVQLKHLR